ncbi:SDR family oxidoreductase [Rheinheimera hassiensis]|jgi:NAD(P)-dependent dehydrogenase (short-subunit alcohol dehydrogenase family)|uniref:SDR family oxidoreductase n=1 Tax=Rheinheimera hassiensis TaxID=1193627 RepID=UPI001F064FEE|nr:SDR family oxidoreductase [Rheinheimera hassiensis]
MRTVNELMSLEGKVAVITGGAGHLGRTAANTLAELGASIVLVDINADSLKSVSDSLVATYGVTVVNIVVDMEDSKQLESVCCEIEKHFSHIDVLINNAAFVGSSGLEGWVTDFEHQTAATWRRALEVNLTAPFILVQSCISLLRKSTQASVINIGSIYGILGPDMSLYDDTKMGNPAAYAASKGGITQFGRWLATVLAPDVRVNTITPGGIARNQPDSFVNRYVARTPLKRLATEEDFKGALVYLSTNLSAYVTGQNIVVDGGWSVW